ncbi:MAG: TMEM14 family protein [Verrucomicrobia bacterium]|nr:TMEM14 family protein [Verrucomicrobiota bacterium]
MNWQTVLWIYIGFLLAGGLVGFLKAGSKVSLITAVVSAVLLVLVLRGLLPFLVAPVELGALVAVFGIRYSKGRKFMPSGMLAAVTAVALVAVLVLRPR